VKDVLWQPKGTTVDYLPVTYSLIEKLKKAFIIGHFTDPFSTNREW
jgi:hypothetical protein